MSKEGDKMAANTLPTQQSASTASPIQETVTLETDAIIIRGTD